ncbi:MAG: DHA2 family efflux MFS transporter permease subunit [Eubacteriales bacterium]|nr:DHA2 family efflux MFS transporter permease subunit [Eubacteriales bacterium]
MERLNENECISIENASYAGSAGKSAPRIPARIVLSVVAAGIMSFCGVVVETAMNISFPALMNEFSVGTATVQWITSGYLLMLAVIMPLSSFLNRRFTLRQQFSAAAVSFIVGTAVCGIAPHFSLLVLGRLLQGIGTGIALPLMYNIVLTQVPVERRGSMMGIASLIPAMAPAVGPSLGGLIVETLGWRMLFFCLIPVLIAGIVIGLTCIRNNQKDSDSREPLDFIGWILLSACFTCLLIMLSNLGTSSFFSFKAFGLLLLSIAALALFIMHFRRTERNSSKKSAMLINLRVFRYRRFNFALIAFIFLQFICLGIGFVIANYAQIALGTNALVAGCILLPGCLLGAVFAPLAGRTYDRLGAHVPLMTGAFCILISAALLTLLFFRTPTVLSLTLVYIIFAFGQTNNVGCGMSNGMSALPAELSADGNAVYNTLQQLFGALGTSVCSVIVAKHQAVQGLSAGITTGARYDFILMLVMAALLVVSMFFALPKTDASERR